MARGRRPIVGGPAPEAPAAPIPVSDHGALRREPRREQIGLDTLTVGLAKVLAPKVRVFSVSPAGVDTDFVAGRTRQQLEAMAAKMPLGKITSPDDVARAVVACITLLTSSTGIIVPVDEGRHL